MIFLLRRSSMEEALLVLLSSSSSCSTKRSKVAFFSASLLTLTAICCLKFLDALDQCREDLPNGFCNSSNVSKLRSSLHTSDKYDDGFDASAQQRCSLR